MPDSNTDRASARRALFSGSLDVEGMDDVLALYRDLFELTEKKVPPAGQQRGLTPEEARLRLTEGFTLVDLEELLPDQEFVTARVEEVAQALARHSEDADAMSLRNDMAGLTAEPARLESLARTFLSEGEEALRDKLLSVEGANPEVVMFVLFNALKGLFLQAAARCAAVDISAWQEGVCPVCGGAAAVDYLMGEGGKRHLICFRCETHWRFARLTCPYCGHENPKESGYFYSEDKVYKTLSATVCSQCQSYIKRWRIEGEALEDFHPEIEDLKTPGFDHAVEEEGFSRGAPNIFGVLIGAVNDEEEDAR